MLHLLRSEWSQNIFHTSLFGENVKFFECCLYSCSNVSIILVSNTFAIGHSLLCSVAKSHQFHLVENHSTCTNFVGMYLLLQKKKTGFFVFQEAILLILSAKILAKKLANMEIQR